MSDFIEDFYYGNIEPQECTSSLTAKVKKSLSELAILASNARVYTPVQSCWENTPNPLTIFSKSATLLRS